MSYSYWLAARVLLYAPSHRQDSTYHSFCYTSHGALAGMINSSVGPPWRINLTTHHTMSERSYHRSTSRSILKWVHIFIILSATHLAIVRSLMFFHGWLVKCNYSNTTHDKEKIQVFFWCTGSRVITVLELSIDYTLACTWMEIDLCLMRTQKKTFIYCGKYLFSFILAQFQYMPIWDLNFIIFVLGLGNGKSKNNLN